MFINHFSGREFDVIYVSETWLKDSVYDGQILSGLQYNVFKKDRDLELTSKKDGDGVLCAVHDRLSATRRIDLDTECFNEKIFCFRRNCVYSYLCETTRSRAI